MAAMESSDRPVTNVIAHATTDENDPGTTTILQQLLQEYRMLPAAEDIAHRALAWMRLNNILLGGACHAIKGDGLNSYTSTVQGVTLVTTLVGSYGLDIWDASADMLCMIAGTPSESVFFSLTRAKLRHAFGNDVIILKANKQAVNMFEVGIGGIKIILQYHQSIFVRRWSEIAYISPVEPVSNMSVMANQKFNVYRDTLHLRQTIPDHESFKLSYMFIKLWANAHGLYSTGLGYLDESQLIILVARICSTLGQRPSPTVREIVLGFFEYYSIFDFEHEVIYSHAFHPQGPPQRHSFGPGLVVLTCHAPVINVSSSTTKNSIIILQEHFSHANKTLKSGEWNDLVSRAPKFEWDIRSNIPDRALYPFLSRYLSYIKIDLSFWGPSVVKGGRFVQWIDYMVPELLSALARKVPDIHIRAWPTRFVYCQLGEFEPSEPYYKTFYLVGVEVPRKGSPRLPQQPSDPVYGVILSHLCDLTDRLRSDARYDHRTCWLGVSLDRDINPDNLMYDEKDWGLITDEETPDARMEEEEEEREWLEYAPGGESETILKFHTSSKAKSKGKKVEDTTTTTAPIQPSGSLRPALDVLHRIRHDPAIDSHDYIIGYEDRFLGVKEIPVAWWRAGDQTMDEFIPQSRILYFERRSDGQKMWDRRTKLDLIFGSGAGKVV